MFQTKVSEKIEIHIFMINNFFLRKSCRLWYNVEQYVTAREAADDNIIPRKKMWFACR